MKQKKIQKKFFFILFALILMIFAIQNFLQWIFLEPYYENQTYQSMTSEIAKLSDILDDIQTSESIHMALNDFYLRTENVAAIFNPSGWVEYGMVSSFEIPILNIKDEEGKYYIVNIQAFYNQKEFQEALVNGKKIDIEGYLSDSDSNMISPQKIMIEGKTFQSSAIKGIAIQLQSAEFLSNNDAYIVEEDSLSRSTVTTKIIDSNTAIVSANAIPLKLEHLQGILEEYHLPSKESLIQNYEYNQLVSEGYSFVYEAISRDASERNKLFSYETMDVRTGLSHQFMFMPISLNNELKYVGMSYRKESLKASVAIAQQFNSWLILLSFVLVFIVAKFLSKMITKPLIEMEYVTRKMVNLDFSEVVTIHEHNEIGSLANHINLLSKELEKRIQDLEMRKNILEENLAYKDQLNEQRKIFMASVSHDFKTPLTILQGVCEGAENGIYDLSEPKQIARVQYQLDILNNMVDNLLTIAKFDRGVYAKQSSIWILSDLIYEVYAELKEMAKNKNIAVVFELEDCFVNQDEEKMRIVIRNLMVNAIQHTPENSEVKISLVCDQGLCKLYFVNPGVIETKDIEQICEAFYRPDESRNQNSGGSGLGLYLVKQILDLCELPFYIISEKNEVSIWIEFELISG